MTIDRVPSTQGGHKNSRGTLTAEQVRLIRAQLRAGIRQRDIAESIGCTRSTVSRIGQSLSYWWVS